MPKHEAQPTERFVDALGCVAALSLLWPCHWGLAAVTEVAELAPLVPESPTIILLTMGAVAIITKRRKRTARR